MMYYLFSWHTYFLLNAAIIVSYLLTKITLATKWSQIYLSEQHKLALSRFYLLTAFILFFGVNVINQLHLINSPAWEWQSSLKQAYFHTLNSGSIAPQPLHQSVEHTATIAWLTLLSYAWLIGFIAVAIRQLYNVRKLFTLNQHAFCIHRFRNISVLTHSTLASAYCFGLGRKQFILLPVTCNNHTIAIRHELQHIRQGDTTWLQINAILSIIFYCNPFMYAWQRLSHQLQEFACDEALVLKSNTTPIEYAECLIESAKQTISQHHDSMLVMAMNGLSKKLLTRRINMLFQYQNKKNRMSLIAVYVLGLGLISSSAIAVNNSDHLAPLSAKTVKSAIARQQLQGITVQFNEAILTELNRIRNDDQSRTRYTQALTRMDTHKTFLLKQFKTNDIPAEILALPLVESGYQSLSESVNPVKAAGVWQIIPSTAIRFGLTVNQDRDDRMSMPLATQAAIDYLKIVYAQFHDWKLAVMAYEYGEDATADMIAATGSRDPWTIASSPKLPARYKENLTKFLTMFDTAVIVIQKPSLIS